MPAMATRVEPELLTAAEAATELRLSVQTVKRWCREGQISAVRLPGGGWRVPVDELRKLRLYAPYSDRPATMRGPAA